MKSEKKIAVLLTCHNRKNKTVTCLRSLKEAAEYYSKENGMSLYYEIFLTDDGCTDGTAEAIKSIYPGCEQLHILIGDGNLYWAGGMRFCWKEAMKETNGWDAYLLLNDDVELLPSVFEELFYAEKYSLIHFGSEGIASGITCDPINTDELTYGGSIWKNKLLATFRMLPPSNNPQKCILTNANILLVPSFVVDKIGIFYEGYQHGIADYDYGIMANKAGIPVVLTTNFCGKCAHDHIDIEEEAIKVINMSLKERKVYFSNPIRSNRDYLRFIYRTSPIRLPIVYCGRLLNVYFPTLYYWLSGYRKQHSRNID